MLLLLVLIFLGCIFILVNYDNIFPTPSSNIVTTNLNDNFSQSPAILFEENVIPVMTDSQSQIGISNIPFLSINEQDSELTKMFKNHTLKINQDNFISKINGSRFNSSNNSSSDLEIDIINGIKLDEKIFLSIHGFSDGNMFEIMTDSELPESVTINGVMITNSITYVKIKITPIFNELTNKSSSLIQIFDNSEHLINIDIGKEYYIYTSYVLKDLNDINIGEDYYCR